MQEIKYISCIYLTILFSFPKEVRLNSTHYFMIKLYYKRRLQNIAINHSADIDYEDFTMIYKPCTIGPYYSLTFDTTLPANNSWKFQKKYFRSILKMTVNDILKILDGKMKAYQAQYDLDREIAKISPLSSKDLDKCEYLTSENWTN